MYNSVRLFTSVCVLFAVTAAAFPAEPVSEDVDPHVRSLNVESRALVSAGKRCDAATWPSDPEKIEPLWLRGRMYKDNSNDLQYVAGWDIPVPNQKLEIGRLLATGPVSLGSSTTDTNGIYDFKYTAAAGGTFIIFDNANKTIFLSFTWPSGVTDYGINIPIFFPFTTSSTSRTRTATKTRTKTRTTTRTQTKTSSSTSRTQTKTRTTTRACNAVNIWGANTGYSETKRLAVDNSTGALFTVAYNYESAKPASYPPLTLPNKSTYILRINTPCGTAAWKTDFKQADHVSVAVSGERVFVAGDFKEASMSLGTVNLINNSTQSYYKDTFVAALNKTSGAVLWAFRFGGDSDDGFFDMTINAAGEIVITGFIYSIGGVPIGNGKVLYHSQLPWKTYLVRISPAGVVLDAKFLEKDTSRCEINSIATDGINYYSTGNAYENFTISSTLNCQVQGGTMTPDIFVAKLDSAFNPVWLKCLANAGDDRSYSVAVKGSDIYIGGLLRLNGASKTFGPSTVKGASDDKPDGVYAKLSASTGAIIWVKLVSGNPNYDYVFHVEIGKVGVYITGATTGNYTVGGKLAPYEDGTDFTYNGQCGYVARISPTDGSILAIAFGPATKGYSEQRVTKEVPDGTLFTLGYRDEYQAKNLSITVGADTKFAANATGGDSFLIRYLNNLQPVTPV